jgi:hypothetical protein
VMLHHMLPVTEVYSQALLMLTCKLLALRLINDTTQGAIGCRPLPASNGGECCLLTNSPLPIPLFLSLPLALAPFTGLSAAAIAAADCIEAD